MKTYRRYVALLIAVALILLSDTSTVLAEESHTKINKIGDRVTTEIITKETT